MSGEKATDDDAAVQAAVEDINARRHSLLLLVTLGTIVVISVGGALFLWLAWLLSHQAAPWRDAAGWVAWMAHVDGQGWFDSARTTTTILAIVGVGGVALVAYRRQDTTELTHKFNVKAHETAIKAQETAVKAQKTAAEQANTAAEQLALDSKKYDLEIKRHQLEVERRQDDRERELRARFASVAEQLSGAAAIRLAGAYALAALADDWHRFGNDSERQVCVSLLCAQLRSAPRPDDPTDPEFRGTVVSILRQHRPLPGEDDSTNWNSCRLDLRGADLTGAYLVSADLTGAILLGADLTRVNLVTANLTSANLRSANLTSANLFSANLTSANLDSANLTEAILISANLTSANLTRANLTSAMLISADLTGAKLESANLTSASLGSANLTGAGLESANLTEADLARADFSGAFLKGTDLGYAQLHGANLTQATIIDAKRLDTVIQDDDTRWPVGFPKPEQSPSSD